MWNTKVRCVNSNGSRWFTTGKIYDIKDGILIDDVVDMYNPGSPVLSPEDLKKLIPKFELVEEELPQPHKSMLKDGYTVVYDNEEIRYVLLKTKTFHYTSGHRATSIDYFGDDLVHVDKICKVVAIYDENNKLIAKRTEKPKTVSINVELKSNLTESDIDEIIDSIKKKCLEKIEIKIISS